MTRTFGQSRARRLAAGAAAVLMTMLASPWAAQACSVCYGEPDSPAARGLTWAILGMIVVVVGVLAAIVSFFVHASRKAALLESGLPGAGFVPES